MHRYYGPRRQSGCGWCETSEKCVPGNLNGPFDSSCEKWQWEEYECDGCVDEKVYVFFDILLGMCSIFSFLSFCGILVIYIKIRAIVTNIQMER